ncbi:hypothetical protein K435DRAFT_914508 [Dendrothele bispora CBS 962.96]|uniref:CHAT domain-containing protein n=1 Tax=Dendrothele bispora (strain CBS 962.96) TaxID=1314807 RepID=A0A4S8KIP4_DENBC|nr:hypothetical protein K435DRAFT_914508 [Dendrothele bispora CBS 962.96]
MGKYDIIHLACHGIQDMNNPLNSAFALYDGRLELNRLMRLSLKNAELVVLSAKRQQTMKIFRKKPSISQLVCWP